MKDYDCKAALLKMLDKLSEKALKRLYQLAEYLYYISMRREAVTNE